MKNWTEISATALTANYHAIRAVAGEGVDVLAVIKADGYGHGASLCAPVLRDAGAHWLGVTDAEEGIAVRAALGESETRILLMRGSEPSDASAVLQHHLTPIVWTQTHLDTLEEAAAAAKRTIAVHVEVDTGMSRQGVLTFAEIKALFASLASSPWLTCEGILSHLCCSEVADARTTHDATQRFATILDTAYASGLRPTFLHLGNTSAVDEGTTTPWILQQAALRNARPMVRTGLALYGHTLPLEGSTPHHLRPGLTTVLTWHARVLDTFSIEPGTTIGYGATFTATQPMRLALLAVGYADGLRREASSGLGNGWVMLHGQRARIVGRVSMNLTVADITTIEAAQPGDVATLLGEGVTVEDHARWSNTIPYEILCALRSTRTLTP